tara:strand:- start:2303 stop:2599 length:297 start_codon:yes stop_codon:yes gene_type:complete
MPVAEATPAAAIQIIAFRRVIIVMPRIRSVLFIGHSSARPRWRRYPFPALFFTSHDDFRPGLRTPVQVQNILIKELDAASGGRTSDCPCIVGTVDGHR